MGGALGSFIPGVGNLVGGGIGGLLGLFRGKKKPAAPTMPTGPGALTPMAAGLSPELDAMMRQILAQGMARNQAGDPLHQAALLMASKMAPSWTRGGDPMGGARMRSANVAAGAPRPRQGVSPQVLEAIQRLTARVA